MWLSGAEGEELSAALALCMVGIALIQPPTPPIRSLFTEIIAQKAYKAQEGASVAFLNWRFGLTRMPLWRIEVAPVPDLSNVATPTRAIITMPITLYGYRNGDDAEEGGPDGCAMGGSMGSTRPTKSDAGVKLRVPTSSRTSPAARIEFPIPRYLDEPA